MQGIIIVNKQHFYIKMEKLYQTEEKGRGGVMAYLGLGVMPGCHTSLSSRKYKVVSDSQTESQERQSEGEGDGWEVRGFLPGSEG